MKFFVETQNKQTVNEVNSNLRLYIYFPFSFVKMEYMLDEQVENKKLGQTKTMRKQRAEEHEQQINLNALHTFFN